MTGLRPGGGRERRSLRREEDVPGSDGDARQGEEKHDWGHDRRAVFPVASIDARLMTPGNANRKGPGYRYAPRMTPHRLLRTAGLVAALLIGLPAGTASAHEMGSMRVDATFGSQGDYRIVVVVLPDHLPGELNPFAGPADESIEALEARIEAFRARFSDSVRLEFDGEPAVPEAAPHEAPPGRIGFVLTGQVPRGAQTVTWSTSLPAGAYFLTLRNEGDPEPQNLWVDGGKRSAPFSLRHTRPLLTRWQVVALYLKLGFTHIVPKGLDHILFVLGIYLLALEKRSILLQVTAFTIAHSITLALTIYGVFSLSPRIVEPLIALSIVCVAVENLFVSRFRPWRLGLVFAFGLLHGMGFAGVLRDLGLPRSQFIPALVSFNVGVELGQLAVIAAAFLLVGAWFGKRAWYRSRVTVPASACIALIGVYWTVERIFH